MSPRPTCLLLSAWIFFLGLTYASASKEPPTELIGSWSYTSMTALKKGKPFGTVHIEPGLWGVTFNADETWTMKTPPRINPSGLNGTYKVHGHNLDMKLGNGKPYSKYRFAVEQDGKVLVLTGDGSTITASRVLPQMLQTESGEKAAAPATTPSIDVIWARQPDTPLRVVRIVSTLTNPIHDIAVKNGSKQVIVSYELGWIPVVPPGCGKATKGSLTLLPIVHATVWPDGMGESVRDYEFNRGELLELTRSWDTRRIVVEVGVVKVEWSDGSSWSDRRDDLVDPAPVQRFACR